MMNDDFSSDTKEKAAITNRHHIPGFWACLMLPVFFDTHICVSHDDNVIREGKEEKQNIEHRT